MNKDLKIFIAGHKGMAGSAIWRSLKASGYENLVGITSDELDLRVQSDVADFISDLKPDVIIDSAAKVGGILANMSSPFDFIFNNLEIQNNLISAAHTNDVKKFVFLGSSCIYPKMAPQPLKEEYLMTGPLEPTNQWYAIAKIAGLMLIDSLRKQYGRDYFSVMPTNLYGPGDNFSLETSHVLPALIRRFHEAKLNGHADVLVWGSGSPRREFMHVDDLGGAIVHLLQINVKDSYINIGTGYDVSIFDLATLVQRVVGHGGRICFDSSKPDGTPRKLMDNSRILDLDWKPFINLEDGIKTTYEWYLDPGSFLRM